MIELTKIGKAGKARGVDGDFKIHVEDAFFNDLSKARAIFIDLDGSRVPFMIESLNESLSTIKVQEIDDPNAASTFSGLDVFLHNEEIKEGLNHQVAVHNWINYKVVNQEDQFIGTIIALQEYPKQILLEVKHQTGIALIPVHEQLILELSDQLKMMKLNIAEGLLDI